MNDTKTSPMLGNPYTGVMFIMLGAFNLLHSWSLFDKAAWIEKSGVYVISNSVDMWAWVLLFFGAMQVITGIMQARVGGWLWVGVTLASISMLMWFSLLFVAPINALIGSAISFSLIYSMLAHAEN